MEVLDHEKEVGETASHGDTSRKPDVVYWILFADYLCILGRIVKNSQIVTIGHPYRFRDNFLIYSLSIPCLFNATNSHPLNLVASELADIKLK